MTFFEFETLFKKFVKKNFIENKDFGILLEKNK